MTKDELSREFDEIIIKTMNNINKAESIDLFIEKVENLVDLVKNIKNLDKSY